MYEPIDYKVANDIILQPDVLILCKLVLKTFLDFPPLFVAEILSPSTALRDRNTKFDICEQQGVKYYLIVDAEKENFSLCLLVEGKYKLVQHSFKEPCKLNFDKDCIIEVVFNDVWENL